MSQTSKLTSCPAYKKHAMRTLNIKKPYKTLKNQKKTIKIQLKTGKKTIKKLLENHKE